MERTKNKLLIVDLDGTLVDTRELNFYAYKIALENEGYSIDKETYQNKCFGRHYKDFLPQIVRDDAVEKIHNDKMNIYEENLERAKLNVGLVDIIKNCKNEYYIALGTTASKKNVMQVLKKFDIIKLFDLIITGEDVKTKKPDPECFEKAVSHFNIDKKNVIIFEDSKVGIDAARKVTKNVFVVYND